MRVLPITYTHSGGPLWTDRTEESKYDEWIMTVMTKATNHYPFIISFDIVKDGKLAWI